MRSLSLGPETGRELNASDVSLADRRRFFQKFPIGGDGCWLWTAGAFEGGYGRFELNKKYVFAHRVAFALVNGFVPAGSVVMHSCDVPACVRVSHLALGTQAENISDAKTKGKYRIPKPMNRKLTAEQVHEIRTSTESSRVVAKRLGCSPSHVQAIRAGKKRQYDERQVA